MLSKLYPILRLPNKALYLLTIKFRVRQNFYPLNVFIICMNAYLRQHRHYHSREEHGMKSTETTERDRQTDRQT